MLGAVAIIPARMGSTRFPGKALAAETGRPLVVHVCERASGASSIELVVVATDSEEIRGAVESFGFEAVMTGEHPNGTSRLAEAAEVLGLGDDRLIVNVQGDEPEIEPGVIDAACDALGYVDGYGTGTVVSPIEDEATFRDPNVVKAVLGRGMGAAGRFHRALYFTRAGSPFDRSGGTAHRFRHVGIYSYTVGAMKAYLGMEPGVLEGVESLEQLRWLEHGCGICAAVVGSSHEGIDTPEQYRAFVDRFRAE